MGEAMKNLPRRSGNTPKNKLKLQKSIQQPHTAAALRDQTQDQLQYRAQLIEATAGKPLFA
jgi:hypothetical protein